MNKCAVMAAKNFEKNCGPFLVSKYVGIQYAMTQLSKNTFARLVDVSVVTGIDPLCFGYRSVRNVMR